MEEDIGGKIITNVVHYVFVIGIILYIVNLILKSINRKDEIIREQEKEIRNQKEHISYLNKKERDLKKPQL